MNYNIKHVFISGGVGVGKSTLLKKLEEIHEDMYEQTKSIIFFIPEYIDLDPIKGQMMLERFLNNGNVFEFQSFILDVMEKHYSNFMNKIKDETILLEIEKSTIPGPYKNFNDNLLKTIKDTIIIVHERSIEESLKVFALNSKMNGKISEEDYSKLEERIEKIKNDSFKIPNLDSCSKVYYNVSYESPSKLSSDLFWKIEHSDENMHVLLDCDSMIQYARINQRGREKLYDFNYMREINELTYKCFKNELI